MQFVEMTDHMIRFECRDVHVRIAEGHRDRWHAGISRRKDVVDAVADHDGLRRVAAASLDGCEYVPTIRFADRKGITTGDAGEAMGKAEPLDQGDGEILDRKSTRLNSSH